MRAKPRFHVDGMAAGFVAIGLLVAAVAVLVHLMISRADDEVGAWPTVPGRVVATGVEGAPIVPGRSRGGTHYLPVVTYGYQVDGRAYTSNVVWGRSSYNTQGGAEWFLDSYPPGTPVTVHYDPANPANAALILTDSFSWVITLLVPLFGLTFAAIGIVMGWRSRHGPSL